MRELHFGHGSITVSFDVCAALFDYAVALAKTGGTERLTVPVSDEGIPGFSNVLIGPATQLFCSVSPQSDIDLDDAGFVSDIRQKIGKILPMNASPLSPDQEAAANTAWYDE